MIPKQQKALVELTRQPTIKDAAKAAGCSYSALRDWLKNDSEFQTAYRAIMSEQLEDVSRQGQQSMSNALSVLAEISEDALAGGSVRVAAARAMLEYGLRLKTAVDTEARLTAIEEKLKEADR